ncbi:hypothetical protein F3I62_19120 [Pseudomonas sp. R-28-1W-6]|uniref:hypothetical protein n=1 Tax=Pseudomonas sp. R-28-1W-6 TaxID=2650101 RepID=UPI001392D404|nr:hypothetical protein [Pseudomonas sp. R-28-1W-6]MWV14218.1 hypothetical protein [Pseudomonas sp. R-28-1W-6]
MSEKRDTEDEAFRELVKLTEEAELAIEQAENPAVIEAVGRCLEIAMRFNKESDKILKKAGEEKQKIHIRMKPNKKPRNGETMTFANPFTGEVLTTSGHNTKKLKEWKAQYGKDVVMGWLQ